jgi:WD40 repeat protein
MGMKALKLARTPPADLQEVRVWDFRTGERLMTLPGHGWGAQEAQYSPDGNWLVTTGDKGLLKLWDANTGNELRSLAGHQERVLTACFSPDGMRLASLDLDGMLCVWDCQSGKQLLKLSESAFLGRGVSPE